VARLLFDHERQAAPVTADEVALREALDGHEILTYRSTLWGRVRFQRALYGALEATAPLQLSLHRTRRWAMTAVAVVVVAIGLVQIVTVVSTWPWGRLIE